MATSDSTLVIDAETGKAMRELVKLAQSQERVETSNKKVAKTFQDTGKTADSAVKQLASMAAGFASLGTAARVATGYVEGLQKIAAASDTKAKSLTGFLAQGAATPGGQALVHRAYVTAADLGLTSDQLGGIGSDVLATFGAKDFDQNFALAGKLSSRLGIDPTRAGQVLATAKAKNMDTELFASRFLGATDLTRMLPNEMAAAVAMTSGYQTPEAGLAVAATLATAGMEPGRVPAAVEAGSRVFSKTDTALAKRFAFSRLPDEAARFRALLSAQSASGDPVKFRTSLAEKYKLGEEEGRVLRTLLEAGELFPQNVAAISAVRPGGIDTRINLMREKFPFLKEQQEAQRALAVGQLSTLEGPLGIRAQEYRAGQQTTALRLKQRSPFLDAMLTTEEGMMRFPFNIMNTNVGITPGETNSQQRNRAVEDTLKSIDSTLQRMDSRDENNGSTPQRNANL